MLKRLMFIVALSSVGGTGVRAPVARPGMVTLAPTADLQAAVDSTSVGATLRLGPGIYRVPDGGLVLSRPIMIEGETVHADDFTGGTVLKPFADDAAGQPIIVLRGGPSSTPTSYRLHDLTLEGGCRGHRDRSYGITLVQDTLTRTVQLEFYRVQAHGCGDDGFHLQGHDGGAGAIVQLVMNECLSSYNWGDGLYLSYASVARVENSGFSLNLHRGACVVGSGIGFENTFFESNGRARREDINKDAQLYGTGCHPFTVDQCHFENFDGATRNGWTYFSRKGISLWFCSGVIIGGCIFANGRGDTEPRPVVFDRANQAISLNLTRDSMILPNYLTGCFIGVHGGTEEETVDGRVVTVASRNTVFNQSYPPEWGVIQPFDDCGGLTLPYNAGPDLSANTTPDTLHSNAEGTIMWDRFRKVPILWNGRSWVKVLTDTVTLVRP